jgi:uncharacterized membrane protein
MHGGGDQRGQGAGAPPPAAPPAAPATGADPFARSDPPVLALTLWPHRSLSRRGFAWVIALVGAGLMLPLLPLAGTAAAWGLLPFLAAMLLAVYAALRRSYADGRLVEELRLWPDLITVERREPRGRIRRWHANPLWVQLRLHPDARVEDYLTLRGNGREIELGAFLAPWERVALHGELAAALGRLRAGPAPA